MHVSCLQARRGSASGSKEADSEGGAGFLKWLKKLSRKLRRPDEESYICYILFVLLFVTDFSILALILQVALFCYALLAQYPARIFWQVHPPAHDSMTTTRFPL